MLRMTALGTKRLRPEERVTPEAQKQPSSKSAEEYFVLLSHLPVAWPGGAWRLAGVILEPEIDWRPLIAGAVRRDKPDIIVVVTDGYTPDSTTPNSASRVQCALEPGKRNMPPTGTASPPSPRLQLSQKVGPGFDSPPSPVPKLPTNF